MSLFHQAPGFKTALEVAIGNSRVQIEDPQCKVTLPNDGIWTDNHLRGLVEKIKVPTYPKEMEKVILTRFYRYYLSGTLSEGDNTTATILDPIFMMKNGDENIFRPNPQETSGDWYPPNKSNPTLAGDSVVHRFHQMEYPVGLKEADKREYDQLLHAYTEKSPSQMRGFLMEALEDPQDPRYQIVRNLAASLCLVALRAVTKDKISVRNAYAKSQFRKNMSHLIQFDPSSPFSPPSDGFVQQVVETFSNSGVASRYTFALVVSEYIDKEREMRGPLSYKALFAATLLTHTSRVGIGMISLLATVIHMTEVSWVDIFYYTHFDCTSKAWHAIFEFLKISNSKEAQVSSSNWSRLISETHNRGLAPKDNLHLATILASCAERVLGEGIWTAEWSKLIDDSYHDLKLVGKALDIQFRPQMEDFNAPEGYHAVVERAREYKRAGKVPGVTRVTLSLPQDDGPAGNAPESGSEETDDDDIV